MVTITVNAIPAEGTIGSDQTICNGATPATLTGNVIAGTGVTYRWESSPNGISGWAATGGTGNNYSPGTLTATTYYRRITRITSGGVTCESVPTNVVTITVNAIPAEGSIGSSQTICNGATPATLTGNVIAGTGVAYRWESSANGISGWAATGGTGNNYSPGALTATTYYRRITRVTSGGVTCESVPTNVVTITVNAIPAEGTIGSSQTICNGDTPAMLIGTAVLGTGTITYRWESSANGTSGWAATGGTGNNYSPGALTETTYYRRITIITSGGATCESVPTNVVTITVNALVTEGSIGSGQTICHGAIPALLTSTTAGAGTGTVTYRWESSPNGSSWTTVSGATGATYQPAALYETTYYRRITIATSGVSCESPASNTVTVTIKNCNLITNPMIYQRVSN
ncbi:CHU large protein [Flavobacterium beibuense]|uniref:CHU large protein n=1 Tax=Flavobacterium beibuense TaxID=657326 RepID=A0A444W790_9FLAO|nr:CHU large protein [Flavobacterium beibuense]